MYTYVNYVYVWIFCICMYFMYTYVNFVYVCIRMYTIDFFKYTDMYVYVYVCYACTFTNANVCIPMSAYVCVCKRM